MSCEGTRDCGGPVLPHVEPTERARPPRGERGAIPRGSPLRSIRPHGSFDRVLRDPGPRATAALPQPEDDVRRQARLGARDGRDDGLPDVRAVVPHAAARARAPLMVDPGDDEGPRVRTIFGSAGPQDPRAFAHLNGRDRELAGTVALRP